MLSLVQCERAIHLCTVSARLRNMAADSFGEDSCLAKDETIKATQIIAVELLHFRWTPNTAIVNSMAEAVIGWAIKDGSSGLVLDFFFVCLFVLPENPTTLRELNGFLSSQLQ